MGRFIDAVVQDPSAAEALLAAHPELRHARWIHEETLPHFLAVEGYSEGVRWLAAHGFDVNTPNEFGDSALVDVASVGQGDMVRLLLETGANPNAASKVHGTALLAAVNSMSSETVQALVSAGAVRVLDSLHAEFLRFRLQHEPQHRDALSRCLQLAFPDVSLAP
ncbi:MAG TPA: ankyrin repeat domain-containing protein [Myxococcaceae bacterium]|nr:ankyrin repeat domain-containing protein [Myxococcaceae bacterium]